MGSPSTCAGGCGRCLGNLRRCPEFAGVGGHIGRAVDRLHLGVCLEGKLIDRIQSPGGPRESLVHVAVVPLDFARTRSDRLHLGPHTLCAQICTGPLDPSDFQRPTAGEGGPSGFRNHGHPGRRGSSRVPLPPCRCRRGREPRSVGGEPRHARPELARACSSSTDSTSPPNTGHHATTAYSIPGTLTSSPKNGATIHLSRCVDPGHRGTDQIERLPALERHVLGHG